MANSTKGIWCPEPWKPTGWKLNQQGPDVFFWWIHRTTHSMILSSSVFIVRIYYILKGLKASPVKIDHAVFVGTFHVVQFLCLGNER